MKGAIFGFILICLAGCSTPNRCDEIQFTKVENARPYIVIGPIQTMAWVKATEISIICVKAKDDAKVE